MTNEQRVIVSKAAEQISCACLNCLFTIRAEPDDDQESREIFNALQKLTQANADLLIAIRKANEILCKN